MATNPSPIFNTGQANDPRLFYQTGDSYAQISSPQQLQQLASQGVVQSNAPRQTLPSSYLSGISPTPTPGPAPASTPVAPGPTTGTATGTERPLEVSPGVFSLSKLTDFYNNQVEYMKPIYEQAQQKLQGLNQQFNDLQAPNLFNSYNELTQSKIAPIDAKITEQQTVLNGIDDSLRSIEDAVRQETGGRASEAIIRAEVARRAKPLELQRQGVVQQIQTLQGQRESALQGINQTLGFQLQDYNTSLDRLNTERTLANDVVDSFNSLVEKGAAANNTEIDNFRQMFSTLLTQSPGVLRDATEEELNQLRDGFLPSSLMEKIGKTIDEQKLANAKLDTSTVEVGGRKLLIDNQTGATIRDLGEVLPTASQYETIQDPSTGAWYKVDKIAGTTTPIIVGQEGAPSPSGTSSSQGSVSYRTNNPGNIKFGTFAASLGAVDSGIKATDGGTFAKFPSLEAGMQAQVKLLRSGSYANLTLDQAMKRWSNNGYGADVVNGAIPANKKMKDLSDQEIALLQSSMQKREGYFPPSTQQSASQFKTAPKGSGGSELTTEQKATVSRSQSAKQLLAIKDLKNKLNAYKEIASQESGFDVVGTRKAILDSLYADLQVAYKEAANLGAITGPDLGLIQAVIKPMSGITNYPSYVSSGGQAGVLKSIDQALKTADNKFDVYSKALLSQYSKYQDDPYLQELVSKNSAVGDTQNNSVEQLRSKYNY